MNMDTPHENSSLASEPEGVGNAVGVPPAHWFVAIVRHNTEKVAAERLVSMGYHSYVATQREYRVWRNGKRAVIERVVIPSTVFVRCTERERRRVVTLPFVSRFMTNRAGLSKDNLSKPIAIVPDYEIAKIRFMLGQSDVPVTINTAGYSRGDKVRVVRGSLRGLEGEIINLRGGRGELVVALDFFGNARLEIDAVNVEPVR